MMDAQGGARGGDRPAPGAPVAALLPVRLETRFLGPGVRAERPSEASPDAPDTWRLRLRILPDTISLERHDPAVTAAERLGLAAFWEALETVPDPDDPAGSARAARTDPGYPDAFSRLAAQAGAGRAAWLVRAVPARTTGDTVVIDPPASPPSRDGRSVVRAFPRRIDVWVRWHDDPEPLVLSTLTVDTAALEAPAPLLPPRWLTEWEAGAAVGLAAEIVLPRHPEAIAVLGVSGLRDDDADDNALVELLRGHAAAGDLSFTGAGRPTSIVHGAPVLDTGTQPHEWYDDIDDPPSLARRTIGALLGAASGDLGPVRATGDDALDAELVRLSFPALWGYGFAGVLRITDPLDLPQLWRWAARWLRPQGSFATLVVRGTAYGVLPVVDARRVAAAPGATVAAARPLLGVLGVAAHAWAGAAETDPGVVGGGVRDAVRVLRRGPVPGGLGRVGFVPTDLLAALNGDSVVATRQEWDARHQEAVRVVNAVDGPPPAGLEYPGRRYWTRSTGIRRLSLPLVVAEQPTPEAAIDALVRTMEHLREELLFDDVDFGDGPVRCIYAHRELPGSGFYVDRAHAESLLARLLVRSLAVAGSLLDLWRQRLGPALDPGYGPEPAAVLAEGLVCRGGSTHARHHLNALAHVIREHGGDATWVHGDEAAERVAEDLGWLAQVGVDRVLELAHEVGTDVERRREVHRALRALLEVAAGRWDAWWDAVGAAHLHDVQTAAEVPPAAGIYGWVDTPWRGEPGPGPGGLLMAPSLTQAATAAALRDRAVHDAEPRWALARDSATIAPARALLSEIADGWHPAEAVGRMIEREARDAALAEGALVGAADFVPLRTAFPLRTGQGHFGCCHGLHVLDAAPADLPELATAPDALATAVHRVRDVVDTAADLLLAESVHGVLSGHPQRAAVATEFLAGQLAPGRLDVVEPEHPGRSVQSLVLAALPAVEAPVAATGILAAVPGFDAAIRAATPGAVWEVQVDDPAGQRVVPLGALGLSPVHTAVLDDAALVHLAAVHLGRTGQPVSSPPSGSPAAGAQVARQLAVALGGRAPDPGELPSPSGRSAEGGEATEVSTARVAAVATWRERISHLVDEAEDLAAAVRTDADLARNAWAAELERERALAAGDEPPANGVEAGPPTEQLADHVLALAAWGLAPGADVAGLFTADDRRRATALAATLAHLRQAASVLDARVSTARSAIGLGDAGTPAGNPPGAAQFVGPAVLSELAAGRPLPVGTPVPLELLGEPLRPAADTATLTDWLPTVTSVRPALRSLGAVVDLPGIDAHATAPDDPWRLRDLTPPAADASFGEQVGAPPRLTLVVGPPGEGPVREVVVIDAFAERVPDPEQHLGLAFDAATPSAAPPQAVLLVPTTDPAEAVTAGGLPAAVLLARTMGHARMADTVTLADVGLGPLSATCLLPQDADTGCPLGEPDRVPGGDVPAGVVPWPTHDDTADVVGAVTADAAWMLGVQWRLGEHLGEDASSPALVTTLAERTPIGEPLLDSRPAAAVVEAVGWRSDDLTHSARWSTADGREVVVPRHDAGALGWWALVCRPGPEGDHGGQEYTRDAHPARVRWPGQPRRRYWEVDDAAADPVGTGPDRSHPATLHLVDVVSRLGDDWYRVPLPATAGTFTRVVSASITDAAGGVWPLRTDPAWSLYAVAGADPDPGALPDPALFHRTLPVLLRADAALEGEPFEEVAIAIDEDENLVWVAVLRGPALDTAPPAMDADPAVTATARILDDSAMTVTWSLGGPPPPHRIPYLYGALVQPTEFGYGHDLFVQARIKDARTGELTPVPSIGLFTPGAAGDGGAVHPHTLQPMAVPASGVRVSRRRVLGRDTHGRPLLWDRTERRPLDVAVDVDLPWDVLERAPAHA